ADVMDSAALLPIDIQSNKLTDWLVSRRICDRHWLRDAAEVRRRIAQLAASDSLGQEGVSAELQAALRQPQIHYWHCDRIAEALKKLDSANKSFLFGYSSAVIRELDAILKIYRRGSCYVADASRLLTKLVQEEAPLLKRQSERTRRRQAECERRKGELAASGAEARAKFAALCRQFGLASAADSDSSGGQQLPLARVRAELIAQAEALPNWFDGACMEAVRGLADALRLYAEFLRQTGGAPESPLCPTLGYLLASGNTTQYEFALGRPPARVEPFRMALPAEFDCPAAGDAAGDGDSTAGDDSGGIDFGDDIDFSAVDEAAGIDFSGIEIADSEDQLGAATADAGEGLEGDGVARGEQARSVLDTLDLRERLLDDLHELDAFYSRLGQELADHSNCVSQAVLSASSAVGEIAAAEPGSRARALIGQLTEPSRQHLMLTRSSPAYLSRLLQRFSSLRDQADKAAAASKLLEQRRRESEDEERDLEQQLAALRAQIKELKKLIESEISQRCDNRRVNIMGEVNAV
ncbi:hypothetical protein BOX15_Mlig032907g3, partial [Macrostomum lignano]